jgi:DNA-directed RNA polymerase specialized sigma24 family protein
MAVRAEEIPKHRVLREVYRHYLEFRDLVSLPEHDGQGGYGNSDGVIQYGYWVEPEGGDRRRVLVTLSFWDLQGALKNLSPRKREAVFHNVILDKKQKDVAEIMEITTVSVGQYVEQAMLQLSKDYFSELEVVEDESLAEGSNL